MKVEKTDIKIKMSPEEKAILGFVAHGMNPQCSGVRCRDCPFNIIKAPTHCACIGKELSFLAKDLLIIVEGCE